MSSHIFGVERIATTKTDGAVILKIVGKTIVKPVDNMPAITETEIQLAAIECKIVVGVGGEQVFQIEAEIGKALSSVASTEESNVTFDRTANCRENCQTNAASTVGCTLFQCERGI